MSSDATCRGGTTTALAARAVVLGIALLGGPSACGPRPPRSEQITVRDFTYQPARIVVAPGDTIIWLNTDLVPHTATADDNAWDSKTLAAGATWRFVPDTLGRYRYHCVFHPNMEGTIEVR
jgi:plastocyanin